VEIGERKSQADFVIEDSAASIATIPLDEMLENSMKKEVSV